MTFKVKLPTIDDVKVFLETQSYSGNNRRITFILGEREIDLLEADLKELVKIRIELDAEVDVMRDSHNTYVANRLKAEIRIIKEYQEEYGFEMGSTIEFTYDDINFKVNRRELKEIIEGL